LGHFLIVLFLSAVFDVPTARTVASLQVRLVLKLLDESTAILNLFLMKQVVMSVKYLQIGRTHLLLSLLSSHVSLCFE